MSRDKANKEILSILTNFLDKSPYLRFGQALSILKIDADFMEEPTITLKRVRKQHRAIKLAGENND